MKILHILDHYKPHFSGYVFRSNYILKKQMEMGLTPFVLTSPKQGEVKNSVESFDGIKVYRTISDEGDFGSIPFLKELKLIKALKKRIDEVVSEIKPDILHAHSPSLNGIPAYLVARRVRIPVVYEARAFWEDAAVDHGTFKDGSLKYRVSRFVETELFRKVDAVFTICKGMKDDIVNRGISKEKITVIPNGVDTKQFFATPCDEPLSQQLSLKGNTVLGFIGSFYHYEGIDILIDAFAELVKRDKKIALLLVGDGPEYMRIRKRTEELGLKGRIVFTGKVSHHEVKRYYSLMDILVYPRKKVRLTELVTPLKPLEAMALGKVVVGSDVGGIREFIADEENGVLFRAESVESLTEKILDIISKPMLRDKLSNTAVSFVRRERDWDNIIKRYIPVYNHVIEVKG